MADAPAEAAPAPAAAPAETPAPAAPQMPVPAAELTKREWLANATNRLKDAADAEAATGTEETEAEPEAPAEEPAEATPEADKKAKPEKGKKAEPKPVDAALTGKKVVEAAPPAPNAEKLEQLKALTKELGFQFDGGKVTVREQAAFRDAKQRADRAIQAERQQFEQELNGARQQFQAELGEAAEWKKVKEGKDYQGIARLMGHKDWNGLQEDVIKVMSDPNYVALEQQRQEVEQLKAERAREKAEFQAAQQRQQKALAEQAYMQDLTSKLKESDDKLCRAMANDPMFVQAVMNIQRENWDGATTISPVDATNAKRRGPVLREQMRGLYTALKEAFEDDAPAVEAEPEPEPAPEPEPTKAAPKPGARPKPRTAVVPASKGAEPSGNGKMDQRAWLERGRRMLETAAREEGKR